MFDFILTSRSISVLIKRKVREAASQLSPGRLGSVAVKSQVGNDIMDCCVDVDSIVVQLLGNTKSF